MPENKIEKLELEIAREIQLIQIREDRMDIFSHRSDSRSSAREIEMIRAGRYRINAIRRKITYLKNT